jgi:adenine-specific DNA-methyltransferase
MPRPPSNGTAPITSHTHATSARLNIPESTEAKARLPRDKKPTYRYSPHLTPKLQFDSTGSWDQVTALIEKAIAGEKLTADEAAVLRAAVQQGSQPWLEWAAKQEQEGPGSFNVDNVILHVHERVSAKAIIAAVQREESETQDLFARPQLRREQALQYYRHNVDWANRLILGDSLQVMSSLAVRENLAGKVQMIFMDPPYGIKFSSNWQNEVGKRDVKDKEEDLTREPEMIKAYRDTWQLGVHSYLTYLKQRLTVARALLSETGSVFVQISDENLHRVRTIMDEVFGPENFCSQITFQKTAAVSSPEAKTNVIGTLCDYILWYAKDFQKVLYNQLYLPKGVGIGAGAGYNAVLLPDGARRPLAQSESLDCTTIPPGARVYQGTSLQSNGWSETLSQPFDYRGRSWSISGNSHWNVSAELKFP